MPYSVLTKKGQTTIPKTVRQFLHLKPMDKVVYIIDHGKVVLEPVSGDITELRGIIKAPDGTIDFKQMRKHVKKDITHSVLKELS